MKKNFKQFMIQEGVYDPGIFKAVFLAGGPGSGKSFVSKSAFAGVGLKFVNSDNIFTSYLKKHDLSLKMPDSEADVRTLLRMRAKAQTAKRQDMWIRGKLGLLIDGTARDYAKISTQARFLKVIHGYDIHMIFINTSLDVALERNIKRSKEGDRLVPEYTVKKNWKGVQSNLGKYQKLFQPANFYIVDNSRSEKELVTATLNRCASIVRRTMNSPHNFIAKQWIERQLRIKQR